MKFKVIDDYMDKWCELFPEYVEKKEYMKKLFHQTLMDMNKHISNRYDLKWVVNRESYMFHDFIHINHQKLKRNYNKTHEKRKQLCKRVSNRPKQISNK